MKGRLKWVFLLLGVLVISATCGFGYQAKITRTQFEEATDAFHKMDWSRFAENLPQRTNDRDPSREAMVKYLETFLTPILTGRRYHFDHQIVPSALVPIPNEYVWYGDSNVPRRLLSDGKEIPQLMAIRRNSLAMLLYIDRVAYFQIPMTQTTFSVFQGKKIVFNFPYLFQRTSAAWMGSLGTEAVSSGTGRFIREYAAKLDEIGLKPKNVSFRAKTWEEAAADFDQRYRNYRSRWGRM